QGIDPALRQVKAGLAVALALVNAQFASDDLVARLRVTMDVDAFKVDLGALLDVEEQAHRPLLLVDGGLGRGVHIGVALVLVEIGDGLNILRHLGAVEDLARLDLQAAENDLGFLQKIALQIDTADTVLLALVDGDADVERALVGRQLQAGLRNLDVDVAAVEIVTLNQGQVALEDVLAVSAR